MNEAAVNQQELLALVEKISSYSVGIAVERNTEIGTGTLIQDGNRRFILTAQHVIGDADLATIRFWSRPRAPLVDKPAREVTNAELQTLTAGEHLPMQSVHVDRQLDLAVMTLDPSYNLLRGSQFYDLSRSRTLSPPKLDGLSLLCFGFPTANARLIGRTTDGGTVSFLGCASHVCDYDADLNSTVWSRLSSSISPEDNFVFKYNRIGQNIDPHGFSGCGVWIAEANARQAIWTPEPTPVGVVHRYVERLSLLVATNLQTVLRTVDGM